MEKLKYRPNQSGYVYNSNTALVTSLSDGGLSRTRSDFANSVSVVQCQWTLGPGDYQQLRAFYNFYAKRGNVSFLIDLLLDHPYLEEYEAKFVANSFTLTGQEGLAWFVSAQIEVIPIVDDAFDELILLIGDQEEGYINQLEQLANYDLQVDPDA